MLLISAGMSAGLVSGVLLRLLWARVAARDIRNGWQSINAFNELGYVVSHALVGGALGLLYWLSWGLAAVVAVNWWQRGLLFGGVITLIFGALWLWLLRSLQRVEASLIWFWLIELLVISSAVGLNCSWRWLDVF